MIKQLYVVYDNVAQQVASSIILSDKEQVMLRDLKSARLPGNMESDSDDFDVLHIGVLDTEKGIILDAGVNKKVINLGALKHGTQGNS